MQSVPRGQNTYTVPMVCRNCGHYWTTRLPLGEPVGRITCPNCECFTGRRAWTLVVERRNMWQAPTVPPRSSAPIRRWRR